jgi:hypothetical protein
MGYETLEGVRRMPVLRQAVSMYQHHPLIGALHAHLALPASTLLDWMRLSQPSMLCLR